MIEHLIEKTIEYDKGDPRRIQHFLKVHSFARLIGVAEKLPEDTLRILEAASVLHDIGIHVAEQRHGSSAGRYQEQEGPPIARELLEEFSLPEADVERICFLIGHHHTYSHIEGMDYQILVEADFLVNAFEDEMKTAQISSIQNKLFKTATGVHLLCKMYMEDYKI